MDKKNHRRGFMLPVEFRRLLYLVLSGVGGRGEEGGVGGYIDRLLRGLGWICGKWEGAGRGDTKGTCLC